MEPKLHMDILMGNWHLENTSQLKLVVSSFPYFMISNANYIKVAKIPKFPKKELQQFFQFCQVMNCHKAKTYEEKGFSKVDEKQEKLWQKLA